MSSLTEELQKLSDMLDAGTLTPEEFKAAKAKLLADDSPKRDTAPPVAAAPSKAPSAASPPPSKPSPAPRKPSPPPKKKGGGALKWVALIALFLLVGGAVAAIGTVGAGYWVASGGLMSQDEKVAAWCEPALHNANVYGLDVRFSVDPQIQSACVDYFAAFASQAEVAKLECQADADDSAEWWQCHGGEVAVARSSEAKTDAGEGAELIVAGGKVGKKDAKMEKAKGNKVAIQARELDREIAENAGVLGSLAGDGELDGVFGSSGLDSDLEGGIGGLIGAKGTQVGSGGLGSRGSGLGGGGTADGLGGLGTKGRGTGSSGYGTGKGNFGAKGEGGVGQIGGDPIILGALDKSLIDAVIKKHMNQIRYCYQRELNSHPTLGGKIVVKFVVAKDGSVSSATTKTSTMNSPAVESCINGRFMRFKFPEPKGGGIVIVSYPFIFRPG